MAREDCTGRQRNDAWQWLFQDSGEGEHRLSPGVQAAAVLLESTWGLQLAAERSSKAGSSFSASVGAPNLTIYFSITMFWTWILKSLLLACWYFYHLFFLCESWRLPALKSYPPGFRWSGGDGWVGRSPVGLELFKEAGLAGQQTQWPVSAAHCCAHCWHSKHTPPYLPQVPFLPALSEVLRTGLWVSAHLQCEKASVCVLLSPKVSKC